MSQEFAKYRQRGAYHWREASLHPIDGWPYTRSRIEWVARQCTRSRTVLEIGCGDGALLGRLARQGAVVTGVDSDETALALAREMFAREGLTGAFYPDLASVTTDQFDALVLAEVIEHVDDPSSLLDEIVERLGPSGRLVLTTPIRLFERPLDAHHVHEFWPAELEALLRRFFDDVRMVRMHPVWLVDLMCGDVRGVRPVAVLANLVRLATGLEVIDRLKSPIALFWTQGAVAGGARRIPAR